jgi:hypothetical protein
MPKISPAQPLGFVIALLVVGCMPGGENADTSPAKPTSPESRIEAIEKSNMTADQKAAAIQYVKQGQTQGDLMKKSYDKGATPPR